MNETPIETVTEKLKALKMKPAAENLAESSSRRKNKI